MTSKVWFITGAARGFGRIWAEAALARGDRVAATARNAGSLDVLAERYGDRVLPLALDVTDAQQVADAVTQAHQHFGRLDVVLNNAGYALVAAIEEATVDDVKAEFETNFFGALRVIQAALPVLRSQRSGHILGVSSVAGIVAGPISGFYNASKWALEALHDSLAQEVANFGIKVTLIEPGAYATDFASPASLKISEGLEAYAALRQQAFARGAAMEFGEPQATAQAVLQVVDTDKPPLRLFLGTEGMPVVRAAYAARLAEWEQWEAVSNAAQGISIRQAIVT
ncbi:MULTISPECIES: SDR family NAD(P)-dependent oxidoreductase [unclassified Burkholderia]|uniref:SDR family NAD(P)-dependent oxidoreductase n=1 Tax=unclassified Burkholderia TaxID=2613784 RepID=UPI000F58B303|nr:MULTISPECIES: SDR family NAD(P)-dependent oxidoreductase [unclassified Burkholderia]RQS04314.1 SDR family NAD(P)-dependent oxidoreductase [Burkholderia sp. Bp8991]RQS29828.1 SDR family NAD(P)-dependent oxidoreductase [Burkholderia sp. Bp8995]RQS36639.1 SDR family NAD(P)-dependent oxidoreductase [Burkholderia sp. Bp8990]RQS47924.1 SDR family NAD(P)-dependent oxidoreductase [Burkholderia sp. Bp8989]